MPGRRESLDVPQAGKTCVILLRLGVPKCAGRARLRRTVCSPCFLPLSGASREQAGKNQNNISPVKVNGIAKCVSLPALSTSSHHVLFLSFTKLVPMSLQNAFSGASARTSTSIALLTAACVLVQCRGHVCPGRVLRKTCALNGLSIYS